MNMKNIDVRIRRLLAFSLDVLFVIAIGSFIGSMLYPWLIGLGHEAYIIGFIIAVLYHGLTNSLLMQGQTPGKIILKLKVVLQNGERINLFRSIIRSFLVIFGFFSAHLTIPKLWNEVIIYLAGPFEIALIYFFLIQSGNRTAHDYLCGTYVIDSDTKETHRSNIKLKHFVSVGVIFILLLVGRIIIDSVGSQDKNVVDALKRTHAQIISLPDVLDATVKLEEGKYTIAVQTTDSPLESHKLSIKVACTFIENFDLEQTENIRTIIMSGYDMVIYRSWEVYYNTLSVHDWLIECDKLSKEILK